MTQLNGTSLGGDTHAPAAVMPAPGEVRDIAGCYMLPAENPAFVEQIFDRQVEIALHNLEHLQAVAGDSIDVIIVCGMDFGTQESTFCSRQTYSRIWKPRYREMNERIHRHTRWKTLYHTCGAVESLTPDLIDSAFDIINPVQCSARGMDPRLLKERYGDSITFWGGGVNTQKTLPVRVG